MKAILWIIGIVVLLVVGGVAFVALNSGSLIKSVIEEFGPDYLATDVSVDAVDLALTEGSAQVNGLSIGNPAGFEGPAAMQLGEVKVALDTQQISSELVVMKEVVIDSAVIAAVAKGSKTNFQQLMENLEAATGGPSAEAETGASEETSETRFIVDSFAFTNAKASLDSDLLGRMDLTIPDIRLQGIGRKSNGATAAELAQEILKPITTAVSQAAVSQGLDVEGVKQQALEKVQGEIDEKLGGALKGLLKK
ncbi:MAG: hypothetical protein AAF993_22435 [Pseudomonadota bacterium]